VGAKPRAQPLPDWRVYLARCADGSLYTGIAIDVARRLAQHERGNGARYTRGRGPLQLVAESPPLSRGQALRLEYRVKKLRAPDKARAVARGQLD